MPFMRSSGSFSLIQTVTAPLSSRSMATSTGMNELGRWWQGQLNSTPPETQLPSRPMSAGLTTCCL